MDVTVLGLLIVGAVGIHVGSVQGLSLAESTQLAEAIAEQVEARTGQRAYVDTSDWERCRSGPCLDAVRARLRTDDLLIIEIIGAPVQVLATLTRRAPDREPKELSTKIDRARILERNQWSSIVAELFEAAREPAPPPALVLTSSATSPSSGTDTALIGWVAVGTGGAATVVATLFGLSSRSAVGDIEHGVRTPETRADLDRRASAHATAANVLFGLAVASVATGVVLIVID